MKSPITYNNFEYAYSQALPEFGEGWGEYSEILQKKMEEMEALLHDAAEHIETYDDGMAGWLEKYRKLGKNE